MKKLILGLLVAVFVGVGFYKFYPPQSIETPDKPVFKVGLVFLLTGPYAENSNNSKKVLTYLAQAYKDSPVRYEIIPEDSAGQVAKCITVAKKLVTLDDVNLIVSVMSSVAKGISPYLAEKEVPHIAVVSDTSAAEGFTNFTFFVTPEVHAKKMVELLNSKKYKKVVAFTLTDDTALVRYDALKKITAENGIELEKIELMPGTRDFRLSIQKAIKLNPDAFVLLTHDPEIDILGKQLKEAGNKIPLTSIEFFDYSKDMELFEGAEFIQTAEADNAVVQDLIKKIKIDNYSGLGYAYDTMNIINKVVTDFYNKHNRVPNGKEFAETLLGMKTFKGVLGDVSVDSNGVMNAPAVIKVIKNGVPVVISE